MFELWLSDMEQLVTDEYDIDPETHDYVVALLDEELNNYETSNVIYTFNIVFLL